MAIPPFIIAWFTGVFAGANRKLSEKFLNVPATPEGNFDLAFIEYLTNYAEPQKFASDWAIRIDTHYLGGLRHFRSWEVADIGVFVFFQRKGHLVRQKVALLQSKRLYPTTGEITELEEYDFRVGMAMIAKRDKHAPSMLSQKVFQFTDASKYRKLISGDDQHEAIDGYMRTTGFPIFYLFYNPPVVPLKITVPLLERHQLSGGPAIGIKVIPATYVFDLLRKKKKGYTPSLGDTQGLLQDSDGILYGWRLEHFFADLLLGCTAGRRFTDADAGLMESLFYRRSGPISAVIAVTVEVPKDVDLPE